MHRSGCIGRAVQSETMAVWTGCEAIGKYLYQVLGLDPVAIVGHPDLYYFSAAAGLISGCDSRGDDDTG